MKEYVAKHFVKTDKETYTPGEVFFADLPEEKEARLLRIGAIELMRKQAGNAAPVNEAMPEVEEAEEAKTEKVEAETEETAVPEIDALAGVAPAKKGRKAK